MELSQETKAYHAGGMPPFHTPADYLGIPYADNGRDRSGIDCWGLVRLWLKEQQGIDLPSFANEYAGSQDPALEELVAREREGWVRVLAPMPGDVVLFRILGRQWHVGVVVAPGKFLHAREGQDSVVEGLDSPKWRHRVSGYYRYAGNGAVVEDAEPVELHACPHPLMTARVDCVVPAGVTLRQVDELMRASVACSIEQRAVIMVDGMAIDERHWDDIKALPGQRIEYRAVPKGDSGRMLMSIAIMAAAWYLTPLAFGLEAGSAGYAAAETASQLTSMKMVSAGLSMAGMMLTNALFPVRQPKDAGTAESQNLLTSASNVANKYGAIPVVLGQYRYAPPLGAVTFMEADAEESWMRLILLWGYGPLQVSDLRIEDTSIETFEDVEIETLVGEAGEDKSRFNSLYGSDYTQEQVNIELVCLKRTALTVTRTSNVVTVKVIDEGGHNYSVGWVVNLVASGLGYCTITEIVDTHTFKFASTGLDGPIQYVGEFCYTDEFGNYICVPAYYSDFEILGSPWTERVLGDEADKVSVALHFPEGLRQIKMTGEDAGKVAQTEFKATIQIRDLDPVTLAPLTAWGNVNEKFYAASTNLSTAWFNTDNDAALEAVYRWTRLSVDPYNKLIVRHGAYTTNPNADPSGTLLARLQAASFGINAVYSRLPEYGAGEEPLYDICVYGNSVYSTVDKRDGSISGCALTMSGLKASIAAGTITRAQTDIVSIGLEGEEYHKRKDAFTYNVDFNVPRGRYEVRVRRTTDSSRERTVGADNNKQAHYNTCNYLAVSGTKNARPIVEPDGVKFAMTAIRIKATNQINGSLGGIMGTVVCIAKDYDYLTDTWITRPTRNPASLFRHVLQHPGNAKRVADAAINLAELEVWHDYCRTNEFMFDADVDVQRGVLEILADIAAAGRASPVNRDGVWSVVIDNARSTIAQTFTPHNSWGFEGTRLLPQLPHGWRVQFKNSERGYEDDERIVYADGYSAANATLIEGLTLPGVTTPAAVFKHARFHFAQLRLRPESYELYTDIENLVCTRGDRVRVNHDVPMWGLGSGRIKNYLSSTELELDEAMPMDAGVQYTIGIRLEDGSRVTRTVAAKDADGYYTTLTVTAALTATEGKAGNLFSFGALGEESVDCLVLGIEPGDNLTARLTLVDYAPDLQNSDSEVVPAFDSQITLPPNILQTNIAQVPTITQIISDESVIERIAPGQYAYKIKVAYSNPKQLASSVTHVEAQIASAGNTGSVWDATLQVEIGKGAVIFGDVQEGDTYKIRLRYLDRSGYTGPWTTPVNHLVVGKTNAPSAPTAATATPSGDKLKLAWTDAPEIDVVAYEVRDTDSGWGNSSRLFYGSASECFVTPGAVGVAKTWYVRSVDAVGLYSLTSTPVSYTVAAPANTTSISESFYDTSLTSATVTLDWPDVSPVFGLKDYKVSYGATVKYVQASTITLPADWIGNRTFTVQTRDLLGNLSTGLQKTIAKLAPAAPSNFRAQVIDNNVMLFWDLPAPTTLPISHVVIKKGDTWAGATLIGSKSGGFTTVNELQSGTYRYWIATVDTDNNESSPISVVANVAAPPGFVLHDSQDSIFAGTLASAVLSDGTVALPVNTTETWQQHFVNNSWTSPQDQVTAGYPYFLQPTPGSGSYSETFDLGTVLASSRVNISYAGTVIAGSPVLSPKIELSDDAVSWVEYDGYTEVFGTAFRYVRFTLTVTGTATALYRLESLNCTVSAKQVDDAGITACLSTDANGTPANFNKEFLDVSSFTVTPSGSSAVSAVYTFDDQIKTGTYSISAGVVTVTVTGHNLVAGQNVRLNFTSGSADGSNEISPVASVTSADVFTAATALADGSGNISIYPQGARIYLFNSTTGARVSGDASWSVKGY